MTYSDHPVALRPETIAGEVAEIRRAVRLRDFWMIFALFLGSAIAVVAQWLTADDVGWLSQLSVLVLIIVTARWRSRCSAPAE